LISRNCPLYIFPLIPTSTSTQCHPHPPTSTHKKEQEPNEPQQNSMVREFVWGFRTVFCDSPVGLTSQSFTYRVHLTGFISRDSSHTFVWELCGWSHGHWALCKVRALLLLLGLGSAGPHFAQYAPPRASTLTERAAITLLHPLPKSYYNHYLLHHPQ
jgi:hypothetical protein